MEYKVELLSPAGNYKAFLGALHAGADAVYLGGEKFGARAYAENFTIEEICRALRYAHLYGRKLYLTVNTLVKESEFAEIYDYLTPLYEAGLDGVIVQDLGVFSYIKKQFPGMHLHISTQMTITGVEGAVFLKNMGADRIVPARELDLQEILQIKRASNVEMECFIHGAMCYAYSGQCLFSSILGGRSGNRGRCAQPCRLPYQVVWEGQKQANSISDNNNMRYPLSLKDMCTIEFLPALIETGIDSFKIEGRMKKPEYTAFVTKLYRKYIDLYKEKGWEGYTVEREDLEALKKLYIRSGIQNGYYEKRNGGEMITLHDPSYQESDETLLGKIREDCVFEERNFPVTLSGRFVPGEPAVLCLAGEGVSAKINGKIVERAKSKPMDREDVLRQLYKTGNSHVSIIDEKLLIEEGIFMPKGQLNELRRNVIEAWENRRIIALGGIPGRNKASLQQLHAQDSVDLQSGRAILPKAEAVWQGKIARPQKVNAALHASVCTIGQLDALLDSACGRIYLDSELFIRHKEQILKRIEGAQDKQWFLALPYMMRTPELSYLENLIRQLPACIKGALVRNLEEAAWLLGNRDKWLRNTDFDIVTDAGIYCFNSYSLAFLGEYVQGCTLPYELNAKECRQLIQGYRQSTGENGKSFSISMVVYGTIPMMVSAGCLMKTMGECKADEKSHLTRLEDRYKNNFPVWCHCANCHNVIYNTRPMSLHHYLEELCRLKLDAWRLDFLSESGATVKNIMDYYAGSKIRFPIEEHTAGHYKRGVE